MTATLTFGPDGTGRGLYTEAIDLGRIGELRIERATSIEFDNASQAWHVRDTAGRLLSTARTRQQCLEWEQRHFNLQDEGNSPTGPTTNERTHPCK
jgi:hypothetical protein